MKRGLIEFAKSVNPCQPAQSAQADMSQNFSLFIYLFIHFNFMLIKQSFSTMIHLFGKMDFVDAR